MPITHDEIVDLNQRFHRVVFSHGDAAAQGAFFLHPDARLCVPHGREYTFQEHHELHLEFEDERCVDPPQWDITQLRTDPERARAIGNVYWEGRPVNEPPGSLLKIMVCEEWIVERTSDGLKFVLYQSTSHTPLPDSSPLTQF
ncbi:MAG: nuclear transport factor 2 family protein [Candidatus Nanopelagicales bacterium]